MLSYVLDDGEKSPLYEQLYRLIRADILNGILREGERLPSRRSFAQNLGVSTVTVEAAYMQLEAEGYISTQPRRGYFVEKIVRAPMPETQKEAVWEAEPAAELPVYADLTGADAGEDSFPFSIWSGILRELLNDSREALLKRAPGNGVPELREAIAAHLRSFRGMNVDPACIVIGAGTDQLYTLIVQLIGPDKVYAVEDPGYPKVAEVYKSLRADCRYIPMDQSGIIPALLDTEKIDAVHISPAHHFPTGRVMPAARRHELLAWAGACEGRYVIEDEYDSEFRLNGRPIPTLQSEDTQERVIYMNTFTKTLASTIRIAYMVLPRQLAARYRDSFSFYSCAVSNFEQYTLARFIERGHFEKHINRMRKSSRLRRNQLLKCISESPLNGKAQIMEEDAGLHFLLKLQTELSDNEFCLRARDEGIRIEPLSRYYVNDRGGTEHVFIVNYAALKSERMEETVAALNRVLEMA